MTRRQVSDTTPGHVHEMSEIDRHTMPSGEIEIVTRCQHCPSTQHSIRDRDDEE